MKTYNWETLERMDVSKGTLLKRILGEEPTGIDYALPQQWLNAFVDKTGLDYQKVLYSTFWSYKGNTISGNPITAWDKVKEAL
jgi:hypothetical protein